jgi:hypothetical protein
VTVWTETLTTVLATIALLVVPGALVGLAGRLRGPYLLGLAPVLSVFLVSSAALATGQFGLRWAPWWVLVAVVVLGGPIAIGLRLSAPRWERDSERTLLAAGIGGALAGGMLTATTIGRAIGSVEALSQTFDAVFHYNAVRLVLESGNASPLNIGTLNRHDGVSQFYPGAWHAFVALVVDSTGASIPAASNVLAMVVAAVVWPLGCVVLAREVIGQRVPALVMAGLLSTAFIVFPYTLLARGVLWPNALATALIPAALALVVALLGLGSDGGVARREAALLLVAATCALGFAHPNAVFGLAVLSAPALLSGGVSLVRTLLRSRRGTVAMALAAVGILTLAVLLIRSPRIQSLMAFSGSRPRLTMPHALGEAILNTLDTNDAAWALTALVVGGVLVTVHDRQRRWLAVSWLTAVVLFGFAIATDSNLGGLLTGLWYGDPIRVAALVPVAAVPLAALAATRAYDQLSRVPRLPVAAGVVVASAAAVVLVLQTGWLYRDTSAERIREEYYTDIPLADPAERDFYESLNEVLAADSVVVGDPWDGSALVYALAERAVVFPHLTGAWDADALLVASEFDDLTTSREVCAALDRLGAEYAIDGGEQIWPWNSGGDAFASLESMRGNPGLEVVARGGGATLFRITACE